MAFSLPFIPPSIQSDYLRQQELKDLATAINAQAQASPVVYRWVTAAMGPGGGSSMQLIMVTLQIGVRRAVWHNKLSPRLLGMVGNPDGDSAGE